MNLDDQTLTYQGLSYLNSVYRRSLDLLICFLLFIPLHVVLAVVWVATLVYGQKKFLFIQERIGRGGKGFRIYKLKTIRDNHPLAEQFLHSSKDLLPLGSFLRRWRIDEFPQIWNVLLGDMSWIGPRPEVPFHYNKCVQDIPGFEDRQLALPGITGWAQIQNPNATAQDNEDKLTYDLYYLKNASLRLDFMIIIHTFKVYKQS
jgi:lipopolysaccharide/colanic/teichoic acid biosynthesis glycosyltransferase